MATIKDVARRASVSVATVSYVLNGTRNVRPETERRVRAAIRDLGYAPNASARNLASGRSHLLGAIVPDIRNPFFLDITAAFAEAGTLANMETIVMSVNDDSHRARNIIARLCALQVSGAAFFTARIPAAFRTTLAEKEICAVYLDHAQAQRKISTIAIDYRQGIIEAVEHLSALGHRRIGFLGGPGHLDSSQRRTAAFEEGAARAGLCERPVIESDYTVQGGYFSCSRLVSRSKITAIIASNDLMAIGALHCAYDRGLAVPDDLSIIGFDDIVFAQYTQPALTTIAVPRDEIGRLAFEAVVAMQKDPTHAGAKHIAKTRLVVRQSTGRVSAEATD